MLQLAKRPPHLVNINDSVNSGLCQVINKHGSEGKAMSILDTLTTRQRRVHNFIRDRIHKRGYGPTVREIGEKLKSRRRTV